MLSGLLAFLAIDTPEMFSSFSPSAEAHRLVIQDRLNLTASPVEHTASSRRFADCSAGVQDPSRKVCCNAACGLCGGHGCSGRPGAPRQCCMTAILRTGRVCKSRADVACILRGSSNYIRGDANDCGANFAAGPRTIQPAAVWGAITTIFELNPAVQKFLGCNRGNRVVVVGDCKTDHAHWRGVETEQLIYLSPPDQKALNFKITEHMPWNHFGRKSIGFMFAIQHGAETIFDFDDDNHILSCEPDALFTRLVQRPDDYPVDMVRTTSHVHNPYMHFQPRSRLGNATWELQLLWPRGFPLHWVKHPDTFNDDPTVRKQNVHSSRVAVF